MSAAVSILLVDDDEDDYVLTRALLDEIPGASYALAWVRTVSAGFNAWREGNFDLVLLDYRLGAHTGLELLRSIRESGSQIPVIMLTGQGDRAIDVEALSAGATDYFVKNALDAASLDRAIRYSLRITAMNQRLLDEHGRLMQVERLSSVGLLAASVAHEVNNPLGGVMSLVAALRTEELSADKQREYFDAIEDGLQRMRTTIRGLLDFAREQPMQLTAVDLCQVSADCARLMAATLRSKGLTLSVHVLGDDRVTGDRSRLMQALLNLLMNACDATPSGGSITISCEHRDGKCGLCVRDTGTGIPKEIADRILEPFFTTKATGHGTGLGLAIVQSIMKEHRGTLNIVSEPGAGTTITLWLDSAQ